MAYTESLKAIRKQSGLTQAEVAARLGLSRPSYVHIEQGKQPLTAEHIGILCNLYQCSPNELLGYQESTPRYQVVTKLEWGV
jgi:transcriptional regulator with XRE-family HTH domain